MEEKEITQEFKEVIQKIIDLKDCIKEFDNVLSRCDRFFHGPYATKSGQRLREILSEKLTRYRAELSEERGD